MGYHPGKQFSSEYQPEKNGRPKGSISLKKLIEKVWYAEDPDDIDDDGNPKIKALKSIRKMVEESENGNVQAFKALSERVEGMPKQETELSTKDGQPLTVINIK